MLELERISVSYGDIRVIFDLSLRVGDGEIVTLIGSNGAGKTTTVNTVSGILQPSAGDIRFGGVSILPLRPDQRVDLGIIQVPEGRMLFSNLTVRENLRMGAYPKKVRQEYQHRLGWIRELFPSLSDRMGQQAGTLSGGEQQMLAIGRGLMSFPKLLLLDEPSIGLAPLMVAGMFDVIEEINRNGVSVLLIEQNAIRALRCAKHGFVLEHGHLAHEGLSRNLLKNKDIKSAYLGI